LPAEARRTRVVEGLPALRSLMQRAVALGQPPDAPPASGTPPAPATLATPAATLPPPAGPAAITTPRPAPVADPLAEDALVDRVIDRLDERLRELSLRHLGFTGGLGT
jgi:hypothetical protein